MEDLFAEVLRFSEKEGLAAAEAASVQFRAGLDSVRWEIEQVILDFRPAVALYMGLGHHSAALADIERLRKLGEFCQAVYLFGQPDAVLPPLPGLIAVGTQAPLLTRDYFCLVHGADFEVALCAASVSQRVEEEKLARFTALITLEGDVIRHAVSLLEPLAASAGAPPAPATAAPGSGKRRLNGVLANRLAGRISIQARQLQQSAIVDMLTGLYSERHFYSTLVRQVNRLNRSQQPFSVVFVEVRVEDSRRRGLGSRMMEEGVRALGDLIRDGMRKGIDQGFKLRGGEFAVILDGARDRDAARAALRLEEAFKAKGVPGVALKIGVSEFATGRTAVSLLEHAKRRLREEGW